MGERRAHSEHKGRNEDQKFHAPAKLRSAALAVEPRPDWHATEINDFSSDVTLHVIPTQLLEKFANYAQSLLESEALVYASHHLHSTSSHRFLSTMMKSGTWDDKVSALTLLVQESPLHAQKQLENLLGIAGKRNRSTALMALGALKDLFGQGVLLPPNRKLRPFHKQPGLISALRDIPHSWSPMQAMPSGIEVKQLIHWAFEDWLKRKYFDIIRILERWCNDEIEFARIRSVTYIWELLKEKPEQEENLLRLLVSKLGDSSKKVASRTSYLLMKLQLSHPLMISVIIEAIESEIFLRSNQSPHAKYYAIITLNQTVLRVAEPQIANKLINVYFGLFITTLNRSNAGVHNSTEKFHALKRKHLIGKHSEQYIQEIEDKVLAQILTGVNRAIPFSTKNSDLYERHLDILFRITHSTNFNTGVQALLLIQQICTRNQISTDRFYRTLYDFLIDPRLIRSSKQIMYLNLLYRSLKNNASLQQIKAFVKRLLQVLSLHEPPFVCAGLYMIAELQKLFPSISVLIDQPETLVDSKEVALMTTSSHSISNISLKGVKEKEFSSFNKTGLNSQQNRLYDGRKRDPEHSNAQNTCLWEILPWQLHFHPSVTLFASRLIASLPISSERPDLSLHTLIHFLDRFAYRNVRSRPDGSRGVSIMQPELAGKTEDSLFTARDLGRLESPLNTEAFLRMHKNDIDADQVFFHTYFKQRERRKSGITVHAEGQTEELHDSDSVEEGEDQIWNALVGSQPDIEGSDVSNSDASESIFSVGEFGDEHNDRSFDSNGEGNEDMSLGESARKRMYDEEGLSPELDIEGDVFFEIDTQITRRDAPQPAVEQRTGQKRRKLKNLPTFASVEEYAGILNEESED